MLNEKNCSDLYKDHRKLRDLYKDHLKFVIFIKICTAAAGGLGDLDLYKDQAELYKVHVIFIKFT